MILYRIDPSQNMARFYKIEVLPTLFGAWAVRREWGRIGGGWRAMSHTVESADEACDLARTHQARKIRRGYVPV